MNTLSYSQFSQNLQQTKKNLDEMFCIPFKECSFFYLEQMKKNNTELNKSALADFQAQLLEVLQYDENYLKDHSVDNGEKKTPLPLLTRFTDTAENAKAIQVYSYYVNNLRTVEALDETFLEKWNEIFCEYKSSEDYMDRLVRRLLTKCFGYSRAEIENVPARVLILRQFIKQFGYESTDLLRDTDLEELVKSRYNGEPGQIDDSVFDCLTEDKTETFNRFIKPCLYLLATIKFKSSIIPMTPDLCQQLCDAVDDKDRVLTPQAKNGTAAYLKDCFYTPLELEFKTINASGKFEEYIASNESARYDALEDSIQQIQSLNKNLKAAEKKDKTADISHIDSVFRCTVLLTEFSAALPASAQNISLLQEAFPSVRPARNATNLKGLLSGATAFKAARAAKKENPQALERLACQLETCLDEKKQKKYRDAVKKKIGTRFNDATKTNDSSELYKEAKKALHFTPRNYPLLTVADKLASATFPYQKTTREYLYLFAIAFEMFPNAVERGDLSPDVRKIKDVQINLFFDYYNDNLVNHLSSVKGSVNRQSGTENMVDGYGINYKNYAEAAFLWCLEQEQMSALEKIKSAYKIIESSKKKNKNYQKDQPHRIETADASAISKNTLYYKKLYNASLNTLKTPDAVADFLAKHYDFSSTGGITRANSTPVAAKEIQSALENTVNRLLENVENELDLSSEKLSKSDACEQARELLSELDEGVKDFMRLERFLKENRCKRCARSSTAFPLCRQFFFEYESHPHHYTTCSKEYAEYLQQVDSYLTWNTIKKELSETIENFIPQKEFFFKCFSDICNLCTPKQEGLKELLGLMKERITPTENGRIAFSDVSRSTLMSVWYYFMVLLRYKDLRYEGDYERPYPSFAEYYDIFCNGTVMEFEMDADLQEQKQWLEEIRCLEDFIHIDITPDSCILTLSGVNAILKECSYQEVNSKNLFDMFLIFLAFKNNYKALPLQEQIDLLCARIQLKYNSFKLLEQEMKQNQKINLGMENGLSKDR